MRTPWILSALLLLLPSASLAQDLPRGEVFGGYTVARIGGETWGKGWNASFARVITKEFAVVGDFSGYYKSASVRVLGASFSGSGKVHNFLFGPRYTYRARQNYTPFAHALFGATRISASGEVTTPGTSVSESAAGTGFGMALGGGIDFKFKPQLSIRAFELDYFLARKGGTTNGFRLSFGFVYRIGHQ